MALGARVGWIGLHDLPPLWVAVVERAGRLLLRLGWFDADRTEIHVTAEAAGRQSIEEHVVTAGAVAHDMRMTDLYPATPRAALPAQGVGAMRGGVVGHSRGLTFSWSRGKTIVIGGAKILLRCVVIERTMAFPDMQPG